MSLKRILAALLALLLVCLSVPAMAEGGTQIIYVDGRKVLHTEDFGGSDIVSVEIWVLSNNSTIVLENVVLEDLAITICPEVGVEFDSVTIELVGDNTLIMPEEADDNVPLISEFPLTTITGDGSLTCKHERHDGIAIATGGELIIESGKVIAEGGLVGMYAEFGRITFLGDELTVKGGMAGLLHPVDPEAEQLMVDFTITLPEYTAPAGYRFVAWSVNGEAMQPGAVVDTEGSERVSIWPMLEEIPAVKLEEIPAAKLPETGDAANLVLWSALLAMSFVGMMLVRKQREA